MGRRRLVEPGRGVERQVRQFLRLLIGLGRQFLQRGAGGADRQRPVIVGHGQLVERAVAGAGAVHPIDLAVDLGPHDDVVEGRDHRRAFVEVVARDRIDQRRLGLDAELAQ